MEREKFFLEKAYKGWGIPAFLLDQQDRIVESAVFEGMEADRTAAAAVRRLWEENRAPVLWFETARVIHMGFVDGEGRLYLFGPASLGGMTEEQLRAYRHQHKWRGDGIKLPELSLQQATTCLSVEYALVTGQLAAEEDIIERAGRGKEKQRISGFSGQTYAEQNALSPESKAEQREESGAGDFPEPFRMEEGLFYSFEDENDFIEEFKKGKMRIPDEIILKDLWQIERISPIAQKNFLKQCEYAVVAAISIMRRAAIEAGLPEEYCYQKSFAYLKRLEACTTFLQMLYVYADAVNELGERILKRKEKQNSGELQERCKNYIARNIRRKFTIEEMAEELGYHPAYVSQFFSRKEGITLQRYIRRERLRLTANLLVNSNVKVGEISDYLCFHSQSYMTEQFAKEYGMTPTEYRRRYKRK